jgi:serine/threonine protein phosphatase 1
MGILNRLFGLSGVGTQPYVPEGLRIYAIGDVHGRFDLLQSMAAMIKQDLDRSPIDRSIEIMLGDYVDRGPDSCAVIEYLSSAPSVCDRRICLKGNHDEIFLSFLEDPSVLVDWRDLGGLETLFSYGVSPPLSRDPALAADCQQRLLEAMPEAHIAFLRGLPVKAEFGSYFFVHAGIRPDRPLDRQDDDDLIWIRDPFLTSRRDHGCIVVHGHSPNDDYEILPNRINVDTGAYLSGRLTCVVLERNAARFIQTAR